MATICRTCAQKKEITLPPVRTNRAPCDFCGGFDALVSGTRTIKLDRNYDYPDLLIPGNVNEPNAVAEREAQQNG